MKLPNLDRILAKYDGDIRIVDFAPEYTIGTIEVAWQIHRGSIYRNWPMDTAKLIRQLAAAGGLAPDHYFRLAVRGQEVLGGFFGCTLRVFFCDALAAKDKGWWVKPEARGTHAALLLLADFERWARAQGCQRVGLGQNGIEDIEKTSELFRSAGYAFTGYNVSKEL